MIRPVPISRDLFVAKDRLIQTLLRSGQCVDGEKDASIGWALSALVDNEGIDPVSAAERLLNHYLPNKQAAA
jgi:uncharacterized membrane protein